MPKAAELTVAEYLSKIIDLSGKTQRDIGLEVGYPRPNVISMMKVGHTKVPIEKIGPFAKACGVDAKAFMRIAMREYYPDVWPILTEMFGDSLTDNERKLVEAYREEAPNDEIEMDLIRLTLVKDALTRQVAVAS